MSVTNQNIINYVKSQVGKRVFAELPNALGECWDLAFQALKEAKAKTPHDFGAGNMYKWSSKTVTLDQAQPGDIIQYQNLKMEVTTFLADGGFTINTFSIGLPRHTAIIKAVGANGKVEVYEQNMDGVKHTACNEYYLVPGTYDSGTTKITVKKKGGSYTVYRPEPKLE